MRKQKIKKVSDFSIRLLEVIEKSGSTVARFAREIGLQDSNVRQLIEGTTEFLIKILVIRWGTPL